MRIPYCFFLALSLYTSGCAEYRISNTAERMGPILRDTNIDQIAKNLANQIDSPFSIPAQVHMGNVTLSGTDSVATNFQFNTPFVHGNVGSTEHSSSAGPFSASGTDGLAAYPVNDPDDLRRLRNLYFFATHPTLSNCSVALDLCETERIRYLKEIARLNNQPPPGEWLYWADLNGTWHPSTPPAGSIELGRYGGHDLWARSEAHFSNFVLAVLESVPNTAGWDSGSNGGDSPGKGKSGTKSGNKRVPATSKALPPINSPVQIVPQ